MRSKYNLTIGILLHFIFIFLLQIQVWKKQMVFPKAKVLVEIV